MTRRCRLGAGALLIGLAAAAAACGPGLEAAPGALPGGESTAAGAQGAGDAASFQFDPTWPKPLPDNWTLGNVVGVAVDARDHVWIVHRPGSLTPQEAGADADPPLAECCRPAPPVIEFNQEGDVVQAWGGPGEGYEWPDSEHGIFIDHLDNVWLGGSGGEDAHILKFTRGGEFLLQIGAHGEGRGSNDTANFGQPAETSRTATATGASPSSTRTAASTGGTGAATATRRPTTPTPTIPTPRCRSSSGGPSTARRSPRTGWSMCATASTTASRCSTGTGRTSTR